jgi:hypothetical protein
MTTSVVTSLRNSAFRRTLTNTDYLPESRLVFTNAIAGTGFRLSPRAHPSATVSFSRGVAACDRNSEAIINRVVQLLFASDVSLRLDRSMPEQKPNLFEFALQSWQSRAQVRRRW